jgi:hypothetical protein
MITSRISLIALLVSRTHASVLGHTNFFLTIINALDPKTFLAAVAPRCPALDTSAEKASQRLAAVWAEPHRKSLFIRGFQDAAVYNSDQ